MWHLLEVSLLTAVQMLGSISAQQNQQNHAQNQLCPRHISIPCNTPLPQSRETLISSGNQLPKFTPDFPTRADSRLVQCFQSSCIRGAAEQPVFISSHQWLYNSSCVPSPLFSELKSFWHNHLFPTLISPGIHTELLQGLHLLLQTLISFSLSHRCYLEVHYLQMQPLCFVLQNYR